MEQPNQQSEAKHPDLVLVVDLDDCLIQTDLLWEQVALLARDKPWLLPLLCFWLIKGRLFLKKKLLKLVTVDVTSLPYRQEILRYLQAAKEQGRTIVLATASLQGLAEQVADFLGCFDRIYGSREQNLKGSAKAQLLVAEFGVGGFEYVGDSRSDIAVWQQAGAGKLVSRSFWLRRRVRQHTPRVSLFQQSPGPGRLNSLARQIRVHQWSKNALVFMPLILSHQYANLKVWQQSALAFVAFSMISSIVYVINDLLDLESDRLHPENRRRPFASGQLPIRWAPFLLLILLSFGGLLTLSLGWKFVLALVSYFVLTSIYSLFLKRVAVADLLVLATLYSWRVLAGSFASGIALSQWFLTFAIFFFFSLALLKRCAEIKLVAASGDMLNKRRGYLVEDLQILVTAGISAGYLSVLILALYLNDPMTKTLHAYPQFLFLVCPLLLFWMTRLWLFASRGAMPSDPVIFALKDNVSYLVLLIISMIWLLAQGPLMHLIKIVIGVLPLS